jgi:hypothetical protein
MRRIEFALIVSLTALASNAFGQSAKAICEMECRSYDQAIMKKDIGWFGRTAAPGFWAIDHGQKMNVNQAMAGIKQLFAAMKSIDSVHSSCVSASMKGDTVTAVVDGKIMGTMIGAKGKTMKIVDQSRDRETWVKMGGKWKIKSVTMISDHMTANGKPLPGQ